MGSQKKNNDIINKKSSNSKPTRRRSQSRRVLQINMAEARREIVQALQLHRSSLSSASATTTTASAAVSVFGNSSQCCYYSLTESMPVPEPIWSTTAPTIPATAAGPQAVQMESLEFEWGESQAAAYSWWLGFLKTLDSKNNKVENSKYQQHLEKFVMADSCKVFRYQDSSKPGEEHNSYPEELLMIPTSSDDETNT